MATKMNSYTGSGRKNCDKTTIRLAYEARTNIVYNIKNQELTSDHRAAMWLRYGFSHGQYERIVSDLRDKALHQSEVVVVMNLLDQMMLYEPGELDLPSMVDYIIKTVKNQYKDYFEKHATFNITPKRIAYLFEKVTGHTPYFFHITEWNDNKPGGLRRYFNQQAGKRGSDNNIAPARSMIARSLEHHRTMNSNKQVSYLPIIRYDDSWNKLTDMINKAKECQ